MEVVPAIPFRVLAQLMGMIYRDICIIMAAGQMTKKIKNELGKFIKIHCKCPIILVSFKSVFRFLARE